LAGVEKYGSWLELTEGGWHWRSWL
jgi:hypothetical protein